MSNATGTAPRCFCGWLWQPRQFRLRNADGASIVIHAGPDDYKTDPAGNSGDRIACGVITP